MVRDDNDSTGSRQHAAHARHTLRGGRLDRYNLPSQRGTQSDDRIQHAGKLHIQTKLGTTVDLARGIEPRERLADQSESGRILQRHIFRHRQLRSRFREFAVRSRLTLSAANPAIVRLTVRWLDVPPLCRSRNQHHPRLRTGLAQLLPSVLHAVAGSGDLTSIEHVDVRVADWSRDDLDPRQVDLQLLGQQHWQRGVNPLPHLGAVHYHGDGIIGADPEPGIHLATARLLRGARPSPSRQREGEHETASCRSRLLQKYAPPEIRGLWEIGPRRAHFDFSWRANSAALWTALRIRT